MKRTLLVVGAVALTLVTAGTMSAIRSITTPPPAANASGSTTELFPITAPPSPDEIATGARPGVPAGTTLMLQLQTRVSTRTSNMGDPFHATVVTPVYVEAYPVAAAAGECVGWVGTARQLKGDA